METLNNKTKWFDVSINNNGEKETVWASENQIDISLNDNYFEKSKNYQDPITANTVKSINGVKQMLPCDSKLVSYNINRLQNLVETLSLDCDVSSFVRVGEVNESQLHQISGLFDLIIDLAKSSKNEIRKQLDYLEVSNWHIEK